MGGNAFKQLDLVRVKREDLPATVQHVVDTLNLTGFTYDYAMASLMGSSGKKATSGDVDFCMNTQWYLSFHLIHMLSFWLQL